MRNSCLDDAEEWGVTSTPWGLTEAAARRLWAAVLRQAIEDIWGYAHRYGDWLTYPETTRERARASRARQLRDRNNARMWMIMQSEGLGGYGFICAHLGLHPGWLRDAVLSGPPEGYDVDKFWMRERGTRWAAA